MFDKDITVINKYTDKENKLAKYKVSHVKGFWSSNDGISINGTQLTKVDSLMARILMSEEGYQKPDEFEKLQEGWTLRPDDYLVKGIVDEVTSITKLCEDYGINVMKIMNVAVKDYGSEDMQHFAITGE